MFWELEEIDRYVGPLQGGPVDAQVLEILGLPAPVEVLVVPLKMKGRTKGYLLGDIPGQPVPESVIDEMVAASRVAGDALTAILRGKS